MQDFSTLSFYVQWAMGLLVGSYTLCLLVGIVGALCHRIGRDKLQPITPIYPASAFPTRWDIAYLILFLTYSVYYMLKTPLESDMTIKGEISYVVTILVMVLVTACQYLPMIVRMALISSSNKPTYTSVEGLPPIPGAAISRKLPLKELALALVVVFGTLIFSLLYEASGLMDYIIKSTGCPKYQEIVTIFMQGDVWVCTLLFIAGVIVAPLGEECCFRGFLYGVLRKYTGPSIAAISSSLMFAAIHLSIASMLPLTVFALLQCWLYEKTKTLRAPMMAHALFNALEFMIIIFFPEAA